METILKRIRSGIKKIHKEKLYRDPFVFGGITGRIIKKDGTELLNFSSNNYLGLASDRDLINTIRKTAASRGAGTGASRLISGTRTTHDELEKETANIKKRDAAVFFGSGYAANTGIISSLARAGDVIYIDRLCHASIIDGARLSGASIRPFSHCSPASLEMLVRKKAPERPAFVITDSLFSMDGDAAPLFEIAEICEKHGLFLITDEAHAFGVYGEGGMGLESVNDIYKKIPLTIGTFSKSAGAAGGFAAGTNEIIDYIKNSARSYFFTTSLPEPCAAAALTGIKKFPSLERRRKSLLKNAAILREGLRSEDLDCGKSSSQIVPLITGSGEKAAALSKYLIKKRIFAPCIRYPTVKKNAARLRFSVTASLRKNDIIFLLDSIKKAKNEGII
ncbi:MAG: aminotransferase class I/II-fold pyridoxal phosphate-dependent enzyme [Fibrobacterota bacterium]